MVLSKRVTLVLQFFLLLGVALAMLQGRWLPALTTAAIAGLTFLPLILGRRFRARIPAEMELLAVVFLYASLFLGEVHGYYVRYWWWDALLHTGSGFLLGILGFLLVHILNEHERVELHMKPGFVAFFAFLFAVGLGAIWEIFEFAMDQLFGMNMQKSGLVDTMWDLIVDTVGALFISVLGWRSLRSGEHGLFLQRWIQDFVVKNPEIFRQDKKPTEKE